MLAFSSALMVMLAGAPADSMAKTRQDFAGCLAAFMTDALDRKMPSADYKVALKDNCAAKETAFRAAIIASDKKDGMNEKDATADADEQIKDYLDRFGSDYDDASKPS
ncbi:MAG: hypothetical protein QHC67_10965 [Sphingobium sp.]|uniref:hypothetical protein n=1 Tax=Sphingobium sp. TaxID=1912891 RepID=UPI0029B0F73D|nr:hypothetical protein [Sphingobium sp.]MDX3910327.1 hypothetical protein [Sphingobium sp.]